MRMFKMDEGGGENVADDVLVRLCQKGDKNAFEHLVMRYQDKIFSVLYRVVKDRDVVRDLAQDVFINAFKSIQGFQGKSSFYTWLYQIAMHTGFNYLSLARVRTTTVYENGDLEKKLMDTPGGSGNWLEEGYMLHETAQAAVAAIEELPDEYKKVVILKEYEDMSYEEIAEVLNIPIGTVRSRLNRARKELRRNLKPLV
ncbi:MAG: sigma-70 family RNA polymerase sigma factor [Nitrospinae bacterium]|nr:sigma-70 family RNA polymerase sigma factor [Nitrospinota bacterium]